MINITTELWRDFTNPMSHQLSINDLGIVRIEIGNESPRVGIVLEVQHAEQATPFKIMFGTTPAIAALLAHQLLLHAAHEPSESETP